MEIKDRLTQEWNAFCERDQQLLERTERLAEISELELEGTIKSILDDSFQSELSFLESVGQIKDLRESDYAWHLEQIRRGSTVVCSLIADYTERKYDLAKVLEMQGQIIWRYIASTKIKPSL